MTAWYTQKICLCWQYIATRQPMFGLSDMRRTLQKGSAKAPGDAVHADAFFTLERICTGCKDVLDLCVLWCLPRVCRHPPSQEGSATPQNPACVNTESKTKLTLCTWMCTCHGGKGTHATHHGTAGGGHGGGDEYTANIWIPVQGSAVGWGEFHE